MITITDTGAETQTVTEIRDDAYDDLLATNPSIPSKLTGTIQEDLLSTTAVTMAQVEQGIAALINSLSPSYAIDPVVQNMGAALDLPMITDTKSTVDLAITGNPGVFIYAGFIVADSSGNQFTTNTYSVIPTGGTATVSATAVADGSVVVAADTLTVIVSPLTGVTSVTNPAASTASIDAESSTEYRARLLDAGKTQTVGLPTTIKTKIKALDNVVSRLVSLRQNSGSLECVAGGGDIYEIGAALFTSVGDPGVLVATSTDSARNITVAVADGADTYDIKFVRPDEAVITVAVTYSTVSSINGDSFATLASAAIVDYINSLTVGQDINDLELKKVIGDSVSEVVDFANISKLDLVYTVNGVTTSLVDNLLPIDFDLYAYIVEADITYTVV